MAKNKHPKRKLAQKMMSNRERKTKTSLYFSKGFSDRKESIERRVKRNVERARSRRIEREKNKSK